MGSFSDEGMAFRPAQVAVTVLGFTFAAYLTYLVAVFVNCRKSAPPKD